MEEATINEEEPVYPLGRPTLVDMDDLVFELGTQAVKTLNFEKIIKEKDHKIAELSDINAKIAEGHKQLIGKNAALESSNKQFIANNEALDKTLVQLRLDLKERDDLIRDISKTNTNQEVTIDQRDSEIKELEAQIEAMEEAHKKELVEAKRRKGGRPKKSSDQKKK